MTPEHQQLLAMLGNAGRLGPFCIWPNPPTVRPEGNVIEPRLLVDGRETRVANMRPIEYVDPDWMRKAWEELKAGPPNRGCTEIPYCPKGWCTGQGECPWSRLQLRRIRDAIETESREASHDT